MGNTDTHTGEISHWQVDEIEDGVFHIYPTGDLCIHLLSPNCSCTPTMEFAGDGRIYTHHSWDGREADEQVTDYLDHKNHLIQ